MVKVICENEIKEKNVVEEGRNRRALKDIGNLDAKQAKPSKPISRCWFYTFILIFPLSAFFLSFA